MRDPELHTVADERRWQRETLAILDSLLAAGQERELPVLSWSVEPGNRLVGRTVTGTSLERRAAFAYWADYLQADRRIGGQGLGLRTWLQADAACVNGTNTDVTLIGDLGDEGEE